MGIVIQKYGGTSVGNISRIKEVAKRVVERKMQGDEVVIVVSAMANTTDNLMELARSITDTPSERELDMLLTAGERISMALLSMAICEMGHGSISFTGSQSGIVTDNNHNRARIVEVNAFRIVEELERDKIVIVAGFQGVSPMREVTTLGRGGSDSTAVALASALGADACEIYTDVEGIFSFNPKLIQSAIKFDTISYEMMLELAHLGAKVMHPRAVDLAMLKKINLVVKSAFSNSSGTLIKKQGDNMERSSIKAVTLKKDILFARSTFQNLTGLNDTLEELKQLRIPMDQIHIQKEGQDYLLSFWISKDDVGRIKSAPGIEFTDEFGLVALVGEGLSRKCDLIIRGTKLIEQNKIKIARIFTTTTSVTWLIEKEFVEETGKQFHKEFIEE